MRDTRARVILATALDHFLGIAREDKVSAAYFDFSSTDRASEPVYHDGRTRPPSVDLR